jgi:hypothetical protein
MKIDVDRFSSSTAPLKLKNPIDVRPHRATTPGQLVVVRTLSENPQYPELELVGGERATLRRGEVLAGVLGSRQALRGFVGSAPERAAAGDRLQILNLGGVIGRFVSGHKDLGMPVQVEVLGVSPRNLRDVALPPAKSVSGPKRIILVCGSCMEVGKTSATEALIRGLSSQGLRVGGAKITGVACLKDLLRMKRAGAAKVLSFLDCGVPSTVDGDDIAGIARSIMAAMEGVDVVVMELGDGIVGHYNVDRFFEDQALLSHVEGLVFCASDLTAAWGGKEILSRRGVSITAVSGPATDTEAGVSYLEGALGLPGANALCDPEKLIHLLSPVLA